MPKRRSTKYSNLQCNRPRKSWKPSKKRVVKACSKNRQKIIHFGASGYGHNYSTIARRSFRARHRCNSAKDKLSARYWACRNLWTRGGSKKKCPSNRKCKMEYRKLRSRRSPKRRKSCKLRSRQSPRRRKSRIHSRKRRSR